MSYIAFLDLLGTKNLSTDDATSYSKSISIFTNCLQRSLVEGCEAYAFSDCAYLEASTLSQIVSTLYTLRAELLMQQRFFVAAVACGTLNASVVDKKNLYCQNFSGADISRVYVAQNVLKGIGISIDSTIISKQKRKGHKIPRTDCFWIKSFFVADIDKISEITTFFDLQISQDENDLTAYLDYTLREYRKANIKSKRYGRYYISLLIYILSAATLNPPEDENLFSSPLLCRMR